MAEIEIRMKLTGDGLASPEEISLRHRFQDEVETRGIGKDLGGGSGFGEMDVLVEVTDAETGKSRLRVLAEELGIGDRTTIQECVD
ncbi:MAG: hypothetical protein WD738_22210 [Pirellulales bacterium]